MTGRPLDRAALVLGAAGLVSSLFALSSGGPQPVDFVHLRGAGLVVLLVLSLVAVLGGVLHRVALVMVAGAGLVVAAVLQLVQVGGRPNWLGGDASTLALMGGLGLGLLAVGLSSRQSPTPNVRNPANGSQHTP